MTIQTIFPNSCYDTDCVIVHLSDCNSLVNLSTVNKLAYKLLSTDFFKTLYEKKHPELAQNKNAFRIICTSYPGNCWKVICCTLSRGHFPMGARSGLDQILIFKNTLPLIIDQLHSKKAEYEAEFKSICGSHYADPDSQIDKAWKAKEKAGEEFTVINKNYINRFETILKQVHTEEEIEAIAKHKMMIDACFEEFALHRIVNLTDEEWENLDDFSKALYNKNHLAIYQDAIQVFIERANDKTLDSKSTESCYLYYKYIDIERKKNSCIENLDSVNLKIVEMNDCIYDEDKAYNHLNKLKNESRIAIEAEAALIALPYLTECLSIIESLEGVEERSSDALNQIQTLINLCSTSLQDEIWGDLYKICANGIDEYQWSEKHFPEHLPTLKAILIQVREISKSAVYLYERTLYERTQYVF